MCCLRTALVGHGGKEPRLVKLIGFLPFADDFPPTAARNSVRTCHCPLLRRARALQRLQMRPVMRELYCTAALTEIRTIWYPRLSCLFRVTEWHEGVKA